MNLVLLLGNVGRDPELRYTQSGRAVLNFSLATVERWRDKDGENQERTEWHRVVVWGDHAETLGKSLHKGQRVFVEGAVRTSNYEDRDGQKRQSTKVIAHVVKPLA